LSKKKSNSNNTSFADFKSLDFDDPDKLFENADEGGFNFFKSELLKELKND
jgi:hypothetical protein